MAVRSGSSKVADIFWPSKVGVLIFESEFFSLGMGETSGELLFLLLIGGEEMYCLASFDLLDSYLSEPLPTDFYKSSNFGDVKAGVS